LVQIVKQAGNMSKEKSQHFAQGKMMTFLKLLYKIACVGSGM